MNEIKNEQPDLEQNEFLQRESGGDTELLGLIVQREKALDEYMKRKENFGDDPDLLATYNESATKVREMKTQKGIEDPVYTLESDN